MRTEQKIYRIWNRKLDEINGYLAQGWKVVNMSAPVAINSDVYIYVVIEKRIP